MLKRNEISVMDGFTEAFQLLTYGRPGHVVDDLIADRGQGIMSHPLWPVVRPFFHVIFHYREAVRFADATAPLSGFDAFEFVSETLRLEVTTENKSRIPAEGGFLLACNHPTGIADGIAMFDLLKGVRPDMMFFANRDALRVNPRLVEMIIPVEWREDYKSRLKARETLQLTSQTVKSEKAAVLYPSGRIAHWHEGKLTEREWKPSVYSIARKYNLPILPVHLSARNSGLFYWLSKHSAELRDITVFHELLNKKKKPFHFKIGNMISPDELGDDVNIGTKALENHTVYGLANDTDLNFDVNRKFDENRQYDQTL